MFVANPSPLDFQGHMDGDTTLKFNLEITMEIFIICQPK